MADTLAANVAELTQALIETTVMAMPQHAVCMNVFEELKISKGHNSVLVPRQNSTFTVQTPTEGDEVVTNSQFDLTSTTISPTLRVIKVRLSQRAEYFSKEEILKFISKELARAEGQDLDQDMLAEFVNFGQSAGTTNTDLTVAVLRQARRLLETNTVANGGPANDIVTILSPLVAENVLTNLGVQGVVSSTAPWIPNGPSADFIRDYAVQGIPLLGTPVYRDGYMTENGSSDFICAMASKSALQWAVSKNWDMEVFKESSWIGPIIRAVADYNSGVARYPNHGVAITADGA